MFAALVGFCIAMLTRHTVAALGALLGYGLLVLGLNIVTYLVAGAQRTEALAAGDQHPGFRRLRLHVHDVRPDRHRAGRDFQPVDHALGFGAASAYLAVVLIALLAVTLLVFRRRDVT